MTDHGSRSTVLAALCAPATALAQTANAVQGPSVLPMLLALAAVVALIPIAIWLLKKFGGTQPAAAQSAGLKVVTQLALGPRERVVVLEAGDRWLLLGVTATSIQRIGTLPKGAMPPSAAPFAALLARATPGRS